MFSKNEVKELLKRAVQEKKNNETLLSASEGSPVVYGMPVQLQHVSSNSFVQMSRRNAIIDKTCYRVELADDPMPSRATWLFNPRFMYRQAGDKIVYKDEILIYNHKYDTYLRISTDTWIDEADRKQECDFDESTKEFWIRSLFRRRDPETLFQMNEANCSQNYMGWEIRRFRSTFKSK